MEAWSYFSKKDYKTSAKKFEGIYKKYYPDEYGIKAYFQMAKSYKNYKENQKALEAYKKIYKDFPDSPYKDDALYEIIIDLLKNKKLQESNKLIQEFNKVFPDSDLYKNLLILQAESFISAARYSEAFSIYSFYLKEYRDSNDLDIVYYWVAYCAEKIKDPETAKEYLDKVIDDYTNSSFYFEALKLILTIYKKEDNYKKEEVIIKKILKIEKDKQKLKNYNKRLKELSLVKTGYDEEEGNLILEAEKGNINAQFDLGLYYYQKNDKKKGLKLIRDIAEKDSKVIGSSANIFLGDDERDNKNYKQAIEIYLITISTYKTTKEIKAQALYKAAFCYFKLEQFSASNKIILKLKSNFPNSTWTKKGIELEKRMQK